MSKPCILFLFPEIIGTGSQLSAAADLSFLQICSCLQHPCLGLSVPVSWPVRDLHPMELWHAWRTYKKHYSGYTSNMEQRLLSHNLLGKDWTKSYRPWRVIYTKEFVSKTEAIKYEKWLKTGAGRDFVKKLAH